MFHQIMKKLLVY